VLPGCLLWAAVVWTAKLRSETIAAALEKRVFRRLMPLFDEFQRRKVCRWGGLTGA